MSINPKSYLRTERALSKLKVFVIIFLHTLSAEREYRLGILSITHYSPNWFSLCHTPRDCHELLYPRTRTPGVQQGTGTGCVYPTLAIPVPPAGGWRVGGGLAHSNSARPDVNKQRQALLINVVSIHHHCPSSFVMMTGKVFFIYSMFYCY